MNSKIIVLALTTGALFSFNLPAGAQTPQAATAAQTVPTPPSGSDARSGPDGILKAQGSIHLRKGGQLTRVDKEMKLSEGIVARPDGNVTLADGRTITLQEGQLVTLDGKVQKTTTATGATGNAPLTLPNKPELQDKGNEGDDLKKQIEAQKK